MKIIFTLLLTVFLAGCSEGSMIERVQQSNLAETERGIQIRCIEGYKFVVLIVNVRPQLQQLIGKDGPIKCDKEE